MAKKFRESTHLKEWESQSHWDPDSDLTILLRNYLPDSTQDGLLSYTSVMSLGLLLCSGSSYEKSKILFSLVESANGNSQQTVFKSDEYLALIIHTMIEFSTTQSFQYFMRPFNAKERSPQSIGSGSPKSKSMNLSGIYEQHPSSIFIDCLFDDHFCLSKMDFIIMLQTP